MSETGVATDPASEIDRTLASLRPRLQNLVHQLHAHPEVGFEEHASVRALADALAAHGVAAEVGAFGLATALRAHVGSGTGPHVAIIAEYDALPGIGHGAVTM